MDRSGYADRCPSHWTAGIGDWICLVERNVSSADRGELVFVSFDRLAQRYSAWCGDVLWNFRADTVDQKKATPSGGWRFAFAGRILPHRYACVFVV